MKAKWLFIVSLFLSAILLSSSLEDRKENSNNGAKFSLNTTITPVNSPQHLPQGGDSPFIRFHSGISGSTISVSTPNELVVFLKPLNITPEKFVRIVEYISSLSSRLPVTREFLYSTPLRSPPVLC